MHRDFYKFKKLARAENEWAEAKRFAYQSATPSAHMSVQKALTQIGRWGYRASKGIDLLDAFIGTDATEEVCEKAHRVRTIKNELKL